MKFLTTFVLACAFTVSTASLALAADKKAKAAPADKKPHMEMTAEQRQKMADVHEKMAACLKTDKSIEDCHKEMAGSYKDMMGGKESCPMHMGHGKHGKGHGHGHGHGHGGEKCDGDCDHHDEHHGHDHNEAKESK